MESVEEQASTSFCSISSTDSPTAMIVDSDSVRKRAKAIKITHYNKTSLYYECKQCKKHFSLKTSHTILKRHVTNHDTPLNEETNKRNRTSKYSVYDKLIVNFVVRGAHSHSIVEEEHFIKMIKGLQPNYPGITRQHLNQNIHTLFTNTKNQLMECIKSISKLSVTFDFWTSVTNKPYIVITAHFVHESKMQSIILDFDLIPFPHTSSEILIKITEIFDCYGLQNKVMSITTDNEATNIKTMQLLQLFHSDYENVLHTRCLAHILNLSVKKGLEKLNNVVSDISKLVNFINFSPKKKQLFFDICDLLKISRLTLLREMHIRWNSTFLMLERAYNMRLVLDHMCKHLEEFKKYLIEDWGKVKNLIDFLKPYYDATILLSKSKYPSLVYVIPVVDVLLDQISQNYDDDNFLSACAHAMADKLNQYIPVLRSQYAKFAVILDPRLKNHYFSEKQEHEPLELLTTFYQTKYCQRCDRNEQSQAEDNSRKSIFSTIYKNKKNITDELQEYLCMQVESEDTDIIFWWTKQTNTLPQLQKLAFHILSIPATSVPSEQAFSKSGNLITKRRNRLGNKTIQASMCLASWLDFFNTTF